MAEPLLEVEELRYTYADGTPALRGVDLAVASGQKVGLVGANGSGKSTLLMCLNGLFAGEGSIRVRGVEFRRSKANQLRGEVGLIFQSSDDQLFMPTVAEDLAFGPASLGLDDGQVQQRVQEAASVMGLVDLLDRPPHHLSMGQKRNAAIASVLAMRPVLLLMDEPSSNLDPRSRRKLIKLLESLETTMLIASHDMSLIGRLCERVLVIDEGRIAIEGLTVDIFGDAALMEKHGLECWREDGRGS